MNEPEKHWCNECNHSLGNNLIYLCEFSKTFGTIDPYTGQKTQNIDWKYMKKHNANGDCEKFECIPKKHTKWEKIKRIIGWI